MQQQTFEVTLAALLRGAGILACRAGEDTGAYRDAIRSFLTLLRPEQQQWVTAKPGTETAGQVSKSAILCAAQQIAAAGADGPNIQGEMGRLAALRPVFTHLNGEHAVG